MAFFKKKENNTTIAPTGKVEWIVACLGNPGNKYQNTRHNAGFLAADYISQKLNIKIDKLKYKSLCGDAMINGKRVLFLKPQTFMNLSGEAIIEAANFYKIPPKNILVIFDDVALDLGKLRIRQKGSDGGHNGIKSILSLLGSDDFPRIKIGVGGKPNADYDLADWVLGQLTKEEQNTIFKVFENVYSVLELIIDDKLQEAMNKFN